MRGDRRPPRPAQPADPADLGDGAGVLARDAPPTVAGTPRADEGDHDDLVDGVAAIEVLHSSAAALDAWNEGERHGPAQPAGYGSTGQVRSGVGQVVGRGASPHARRPRRSSPSTAPRRRVLIRRRPSPGGALDDCHRALGAVDLDEVAGRDRRRRAAPPTTHGMPYSRLTMAAWVREPPTSHTHAAMRRRRASSWATSPRTRGFPPPPAR